MPTRRFDLAPCAAGTVRALLLTSLFAAGCAREAFPVALSPAPATTATPATLAAARPWQVPPRLARIPPPVAPYVWPDPLQPLPNVAVPQWAGVAAAPFAATVQRAAIYYQLPAELIWAVMKVESNFRDQAVSRVGARGLMQLMPRTAAAIGIRDPLDPEQNILAGAYYLRHLANRFGGDIYFTLAAYNAGPGTVRRYGGIPPYPETLNYIRKVLTYYVNTVPTAL
jgi:soluble lytic murein transglycosylase-like protein